ncbi:MAG: UDP-N-acetylglucosamine--N-acetylmuramyl-(pentapeptide) pyrophosphoryl-undecaprenol N-acetylglucosamine transferase [Pirellulales bacterium]|nr:UDP-N-acetylglucosamine--N-acetylmuramyl-(pentapeptide) pyrophosphoryl-undecaprenol N-acetylglucosamine transferase [Pirellulales bacterium]
MTKTDIHIVFAGGGTAGHLFPGLAVAERIAETAPHARITFCGVGKPLEQRAVAAAGFEYLRLPARPLPRGVGEAVAFALEQFSSAAAAGRFLRGENVAAVVALGGYACVPMARAAIKHDVPLVLLEQNVVPGKATRWLANRASLICTSYDETRNKLRCRCPVRTTGNPIRRGFVKLRPLVAQILISPGATTGRGFTEELPHRRLLVLGGSGGARALNVSVPPALYKVSRQLRGWRIMHQCGEEDAEPTRALYRKFALNAEVEPFFDDLPERMAETDLAVSRAGGSTVAELSAAGVPAVLIPYPRAADDHQAANARRYASGGGCVTIDQRRLAGRLDDELAERLCLLLADDALRGLMSSAMRRLARPHAAEDAAELIWSIAASRAHEERIVNKQFV